MMCRVLWLVLCVALLVGAAAARPLPNVRPPPEKRTFVSTEVDKLIANYSSRMQDEDLATLFSNCWPNTLDTTVKYHDPKGPDTFVITGDIDAMWLRDSAAQTLSYITLVRDDEALRTLTCGVIQRQARYIVHDVFANSFQFDSSSPGPHADDKRRPNMTNLVFEGKYELDSLAWFLHLSQQFYVHTGAASLSDCFNLNDGTWRQAVSVAVDAITAMQAGTMEEFGREEYLFARDTFVGTDTTINQGRGPMAKRCGLSKCTFRPSDDSMRLPFLVPANAMASAALSGVAAVLARNDSSDPLATEVASLGKTIADAVHEQAVTLRGGTKVYAYEVDGFGSSVTMDDANLPSLLGLPLFGFTDMKDQLYLNTRALLLSDSNPYFFHGSAGEGIGGPHVGPGRIWPMSIIVRALTSDDDQEISTCLATLVASSADTGLLHESFWKDDVTSYSRPWFAWVNGMLGQLILQLAEERPHLIF